MGGKSKFEKLPGQDVRSTLNGSEPLDTAYSRKIKGVEALARIVRDEGLRRVTPSDDGETISVRTPKGEVIEVSREIFMRATEVPPENPGYNNPKNEDSQPVHAAGVRKSG